MGIFDRLFGPRKTPSQSKSAWKVINPRIPCKKPFHLLERVFVFASGDASKLSGSVLAGYLQDAAENTLEEIIKRAGGTDMISNSTIEAEINQTGKIPESALQAMGTLAPALIVKVRNGAVRVCVRTLDDPPSGQSAALFLLYRNP